MPSVAERTRNNVRAGIFVSLALLLILAIIIALADIRTLLQPKTTYTAVFTVASGVTNLTKGSEVHVGGLPLGRVKTIEPRVVPGQAFEEIEVEFTLDERVPLYADAIVLVAAPIIGSDAWLSIPDVGTPTAGAPQNNRIIGASTLGLMTTLLGPESGTKAAEVVENVRKFSALLASLQEEYDASIKPTLENIAAITQDFRDTRWPHWATSVDHVMTWATEFTARIDDALAQARGAMADAREVMAENRAGVRRSIANVEAATERFKTETIDKVNRLLDSGQEGLDSAVATIERLQTDYEAWSVDIGESLANANLASQQLKLATIEIRRSPWKLLYQPSPDELEHELLYEATRSFALAAADLKDSAESVRRIMDNHPDQVARDPETYKRIQQSLLDSLDRYEKAQKQMLDVILADSPK